MVEETNYSSLTKEIPEKDGEIILQIIDDVIVRMRLLEAPSLEELANMPKDEELEWLRKPGIMFRRVDKRLKSLYSVRWN